MSTRDVTTSIDHHHKRRANCQWRDDSRASADYRAANCQNQEERSDEFGDIFVHRSILSRHSLEKARHIGGGTLVSHAVSAVAERRAVHEARSFVFSTRKMRSLRQAASFIQINSRIIAPIIDMMKPAG